MTSGGVFVRAATQATKQRWNAAASIDNETLKAIIEIEIDRVEIGESDMPVVASQWKPCTPSSPIADDLSIPAFLRRRPAS